MGILTRFKDIMSANIKALLDKCEDPEKMIDQYMRNLESDLGKVKAETASVMAEETSTEEASTEAATEAGSEAAESDQVENNWEPFAENVTLRVPVYD